MWLLFKPVGHPPWLCRGQKSAAPAVPVRRPALSLRKFQWWGHVFKLEAKNPVSWGAHGTWMWFPYYCARCVLCEDTWRVSCVCVINSHPVACSSWSCGLLGIAHAFFLTCPNGGVHTPESCISVLFGRIVKESTSKVMNVFQQQLTI